VTASAASAALPAAVLCGIVRTSLGAATGTAAVGSISPRVAALTEGVTKAMVLTRAKSIVALFVVLAVLAAAGVCARQGLSARNPVTEDERGATPQVKGRDSKTEKEKRARMDLHGDPLPPGARARLGTVRFRHTASVRGAGFSGDGKMLITEDYTGLILFWDAATGKELRRFQLPGTLTSVGVSPDGKIL